MIVHVCDMCGEKISGKFLDAVRQDLKLPMIEKYPDIPEAKHFNPMLYGKSIELCEDCWRKIAEAIDEIKIRNREEQE